MKQCPQCRRVYSDETQNFCLEDGEWLRTADSFSEAPTITSARTGTNRDYRATSDLLENRTDDAAWNESIAVLSFANLSNDPANDYFCDGLAEELMRALVTINGLKVAARTSAFTFKNKHAAAREIGAALQVNNILEGSVRRSGGRLRIAVQLVSVNDGYQIWSEIYDKELKDVFDIQDEITMAVVEMLKVRLIDQKPSAILKRQTNDLHAYELLLKGKYCFEASDMARVKQALAYFEQAIAADPGYALAYANLSWSYLYLAGMSVMDPDLAVPKAEDAAKMALELDPGLAEAFMLLATLDQFRWNWNEAEVEFKRAVELDPGSGDIHYRYSALLAARGRHDEAIAEIIRALELDPLSPRISANLGYRLVFARRHDEAETELTRTLEWAPEYSFAHLYRGYNFAAVGAYDEAIRSYKEAIRHGSLSSSTKAYLGAAYARSGREEVAEKFLNDLLTGEEYASPGELPVLMGALGRNDEAFKSFDRAFESHDLQLQFIKVDPALDPLRGDPRFDDLLARVGLS